MKLTWMGPYRDFVESLVLFGNVWAQALSKSVSIPTSVPLFGQELQVLEYILENEELHQKMAQIAQRLSIPQSSFSKLVKQLVKKGLLEKYHSANNLKDVIVRPTELGRSVYLEYARRSLEGKWGQLFARLDALPPEAIETMTAALNEFSGSMVNTVLTKPDTPPELIRIDP